MLRKPGRLASEVVRMEALAGEAPVGRPTSGRDRAFGRGTEDSLGATMRQPVCEPCYWYDLLTALPRVSIMQDIGEEGWTAPDLLARTARKGDTTESQRLGRRHEAGTPG